jgi:NADH dehydrogenase
MSSHEFSQVPALGSTRASSPLSTPHHVVIIGGGFAGLYAAKSLRRAPVRVTLVDRRNFHLFQPLLYQVATGEVSPGDISSPLRSILERHKNTWVLAADVTGLDPAAHKVILRDGELTYDTLIVATGVSHFYFGRDEWATTAPGLKTLEDALEMRRRILLAFEAAEREPDPARRQAWMTFVVVGGGPTGAELAGALGELARNTLEGDFRNIDPADARIILIEGMERILPTYPPQLSAKAEDALKRLGVTIYTATFVTDLPEGIVRTRPAGDDKVADTIPARTVLWAAGVKASPLAQVLAERTGVELDRAGRVIVTPHLTVPGHDNILVIGDLAHFAHQTGQPLPGVAPVAMQQGRYAAELVRNRLNSRETSTFHYRDKGSLAVLGRNKAVADFGRFQLSGFFAWLVWVFVHIGYLIEFDNKLKVLLQWAWNYFTDKRGTRLITGPDPFPLIQQPENQPPGGFIHNDTPAINLREVNSEGE